MAPIYPIHEGPITAGVPAKRAQAAPEETTPPLPSPAPDPRADREAMVEIVAQMQKSIEGTAAAPHSVAFRQDGDSNDFVIEIRDPHGELIKQFPPEKVLNLRRKLDELTGMVIDQMT